MLGDKKLFLLDIDGTICKGNQLIGGTKEFLSDIEKNGGKYIFITNNASFMCILTGLLNQNSYLNRTVEEPRNGQCSLYFATDRCKIYLSSLSRTDGFFLFCYNKIKEKNTSDMSQKERGMV